MWSTNKHLQHYYLRQGFIYVRTVALPTTHPGPCFSGQPSECHAATARAEAARNR
jgi:hypothetical protein